MQVDELLIDDRQADDPLADDPLADDPLADDPLADDVELFELLAETGDVPPIEAGSNSVDRGGRRQV